MLKRPCTTSVRVASGAVKGTREQLYTNLQREFHTFVSRAGVREKIRGSNVLSFLACSALRMRNTDARFYTSLEIRGLTKQWLNGRYS